MAMSTTSPFVADLRVYPVKSLPATVMTVVNVLPSGALEFDRRWAFVDETSRFWNGKRTPRIHALECRLNPETREIEFAERGGSLLRWCVGSDPAPLEAWFGERLEGRALLRENSDTGFPDDLESPGPTVISTASLEEIASWFPGLDAAEVRHRLRANIEIGGVPAFWEDQLFGAAGELRPFQLGAVTLGGVNPCARCVVPTRDSQSGAIWTGFQKAFAQRRQATLPAWSPADRFNHFYRASVNTRLVDGAGKQIRVGDQVTLLS